MNPSTILPKPVIKGLFFEHIPLKELVNKTSHVCKDWQVLVKEIILEKLGESIQQLKKCNNEELADKCCKNIELAKFVFEFNFRKLENKHIVKIGQAYPEFIFSCIKDTEQLTDIDLLTIAASSLETAKAIQNYPKLMTKMEDLYVNMEGAFSPHLFQLSGQYYEFKSKITGIPTSAMTFRFS